MAVEENSIQILTVNDRMDEKKVPSSYLDSLDNTPSNTETNCNAVSHEYLEHWLTGQTIHGPASSRAQKPTTDKLTAEGQTFEVYFFILKMNSKSLFHCWK